MVPQHEDEHQLYLGVYDNFQILQRKVYKQGAGARQLSCVHLVWEQRTTNEHSAEIYFTNKEA